MSHSKSENLIVSFKSTNSVLQPYDGTHNAIDINEVRQFSPLIFVKHLILVLSAYSENYFSNLNVLIECKYTFNKDPEVNSNLEAPIFAVSNGDKVTTLVIEELRQVASYALSLTQDSSDLFDMPENITQLSNEKLDFVEEFSRSFIEKHGGKNIPKPFEWKTGGHNRSFTPFQGRIRPNYISNKIDETDFILSAKLDGFKNSEMLIYLQEVDSELNLNPTSVTYKAKKPSLLKAAADIYANSSPAYVTVTAFKKADEKGRIGLYIRDITSYEFDELTELSASD